MPMAFVSPRPEPAVTLAGLSNARHRVSCALGSGFPSFTPSILPATIASKAATAENTAPFCGPHVVAEIAFEGFSCHEECHGESQPCNDASHEQVAEIHSFGKRKAHLTPTHEKKKSRWSFRQSASPAHPGDVAHR